MSDVYLIEVAGRAAGVVARDHAGKLFRFHAAIPESYEIDGRLFKSPADAQKAARKVMGAKKRGRLEVLDHAA